MSFWNFRQIDLAEVGFIAKPCKYLFYSFEKNLPNLTEILQNIFGEKFANHHTHFFAKISWNQQLP